MPRTNEHAVFKAVLVVPRLGRKHCAVYLPAADWRAVMRTDVANSEIAIAGPRDSHLNAVHLTNKERVIGNFVDASKPDPGGF
jgi:hypothetical protein